MVAFIGMTFAVLFNIPIHTNSVRTAVNGIWVRAMKLDEKADASTRKKILSVIIIVVTNLTALCCDSLGLTVAINGAVCATLMMYVFPALMYMKSGASAEPFMTERFMPWLTVTLGVIIGVAGVATTVMQASGESDILMPPQ